MPTKTEAASEVRKVLQLVKDRLQQLGGAKVNEATTRAHFITPLLAALGYRSIDDIQFEVYLPDGKTFLDYQLVVDERTRVAVEAKALEWRLAEKDGAQAVQYASLLGDQWAVVTNGREWWLYETFAQVPLADRLIVRTDLLAWDSDAEFNAVFEQLWLVSKEAFATSGGPAAWLTSKRLDQVMRRALTDPKSPEVKYLRKRVDSDGLSVSADQVASWLKMRLDAATPTAAPPTVGIGPTPPGPSRAAETHIPYAQPSTEASAPRGGPNYWLIPAGRRGTVSATDHLRMWLTRGFWGFGERTPGRRRIQPGDWACFYAAEQAEVLAYGRVAGLIDTPVSATEWPEPRPYAMGVYKVPLSDVTWLQPPIRVDGGLRQHLDALKGKSPSAIRDWSWLVQTTRRLTAADFGRLTNT